MSPSTATLAIMRTRRQIAQEDRRPPPPPPPRRRGGTLVSPRGQDAIGDDFVQVEQPEDRGLAALETQAADLDGTATDLAKNGVQTEESWILRLRIPIQPERRYGSTISLHVTPRMTPDTLSSCILQAVLHHFSVTNPSLVLDTRENRFFGLFAESTGVFFSLEHLLTSTQDRNQVFLTHLPPPRRELAIIPWWQRWETWAVVAAIVVAYKLTAEFWTIIDTIGYVISTIYWSIMELPLKELYRYGPWFIGWEGASLAQICHRISHYGNTEFWLRNASECEQIYSSKEEAFLRLARPALWIVLLVSVVLIVRWTIMEIWGRPHAHSQLDRDMIDLYRAWQVILRQTQRMGGPPGERHALRHRNERRAR